VRIETRLRAFVALELVAAGVGLSFLGITRSGYVQPPIPYVSQTPPPPHTRLEAVPLLGTTRSAPITVTIPALGVSSPLGPARGLNDDGTINDAPLSGPAWSLPWWYDGGPSPGQAGSAVLLGHVDSAVGAGRLGVFFRLGELNPGDAVLVRLANDALTRWTIVSTVVYDDRRFPDAVVFGRSGPPTLRLVTCGGRFNWETHHYESTVVVTAAETD
jgi:Sortase domain